MCFFYIDGDTLTVTMDGSSRFAEWANNFMQFGFFRRKKENERGRHFGMARSGNLLYKDFKKKCGYIGDVKAVKINGKSRGGCLALQFAENFVKEFKLADITVVDTFGCPEFYDIEKAEEFMLLPLFEHNRFILENDFVGKMGLNLHHWQTKLIMMPTVKGKLDHLAYRESLDSMDVKG
ncbi:MAG: hypothetical protein U9N61_01690 [Euryarchaeota archaeon]|nr:hypothetical protein [Euryarchaeota archaeon]